MTLELTVLVVVAFAGGILLGMMAERLRRGSLIEEAADATVDELVARQVAEDRRALESLPPGVDGADALELAARHGIGVREAALILFRDQARARLEANLRRHHGRPRRASGGA